MSCKYWPSICFLLYKMSYKGNLPSATCIVRTDFSTVIERKGVIEYTEIGQCVILERTRHHGWGILVYAITTHITTRTF